MEKINTIAGLEAIIGTTEMEGIIRQHALGDGDWLIDVVSEHDENIDSGSQWFLPEFHGKLRDAKVPVGNIDASAIYDRIQGLLDRSFNQWLRIFENKDSMIGFDIWVEYRGDMGSIKPHVEAIRNILAKRPQ